MRYFGGKLPFALCKINVDQGGNFGSEKSAKSDRRRQIFRSAGIRSAEPSNFVGKIGESEKSGDRQNRQIGKIGRSAKIGKNARGVHLENTRAQRTALIGCGLYHTHTHLPHHYTKPKQPDFLTASFSYLIGWNWALHVTRRLSIHSQGFNIVRRLFFCTFLIFLR